MKYVDVVIDNNNDNTDNLYTYCCESDDIKIGDKVYVPFAKGDRVKEGYVFRISDEIDKNIKRIKNIIAIDEEVYLSEEAVKTCCWIKKQYLCKYIDAIKCFIPSGESSKTGKLRIPYREVEFDIFSEKILTEEQRLAVDIIGNTANKNEHKVFLIHGVTSSGKTEIYMHAIKNCINKGQTAIMLVPEIALTTQTIERFVGRFGSENIAILHSKLSLGERYDEWIRIKQGNVKIVIGARSAIFAPLENIGIVVIDEEHETTYKSDMTPKYDAIEVAIQRARINNSVVLLGSATPSLISMYKAEIGEYEKINLKHRHNKAPLPKVSIVDMREELKNGNKTIFSIELYNLIKKNLEEKKQIILFLNRRGYSTFVSCRTCGYVMKCPECGISLTYHKGSDEAICHFCGYREKVPQTCPDCNGKYIRHFGTGTEKVEEATKEIFKEASVERLDLDTTSKKGSIDRILNRFKKGTTNILIGTQLVAKGLDFSNVGLVGIISADISLNIPDFRSSERTFQLITQAAGRAGRGDFPGKVVIQSYSPEHYSILAAARNDYQYFYETEKHIRRQIGYPPFSDIIQIIISSQNEEEALTQSCKITEDFILKAGNDSREYIFGPSKAPMNKVKGFYRFQIIIKCLKENREEYSKILDDIRVGISKDKKASYNISVDVNPYSFL